MESGANNQQIVEALIESQDMLQEENKRLRNSNRILRTVVRALRETNKVLFEKVELATQNDEIFKSFCNGEFDVPVAMSPMAGLAAAPVVDTVAADPVKASTTV